MPVKLNNGGHFQEYDPMTGEYISGSENDDSNELQLKSHVIEAKRNIDKAKKDSNIQVPFPKEYSYDKEYAQQYIELLIQRNGKLNIDTSSVRFLAFDNRKLFFQPLLDSKEN